MLDAMLLTQVFAVLFVIALVTVRVRARAGGPAPADAPPPARGQQPLRQLRFQAAEYALRVSDRVTLSCRADESWEDATGQWVPVETKTRHRLYPGDVIELSAVGYALRHQTDPTRTGPCAAYGYVRLAPLDGTALTLIPVALFSDAQVETLISHYLALRCGLAVAQPDPRENKCRHCAFGRGLCPDSLCGAGGGRD